VKTIESSRKKSKIPEDGKTSHVLGLEELIIVKMPTLLVMSIMFHLH
jgi:hypothetical protein